MKKRSITLLEIMIVILLIGLIGGVVSYNLKGTLDKGKAFASQEGCQKLEDILNLEIQLGHTSVASLIGDKSDNRAQVQEAVKFSGLVPPTKIEKFIKDGWDTFYQITKVPHDESVAVSSSKLESYKEAHGEPKKK